MPKTKKLSLNLYAWRKGSKITATQRRQYHAAEPGRYARDVKDLETQLNKCRHANTLHEDGYICVSATHHGANAHLLASIFNRLSYIVDEGQVARQSQGKVYIAAGHYQTVLQTLYGEADMPANYSAAPLPESGHLGLIRTWQERKQYHDKNPGRFRRSVNFLQNRFFSETAEKNKMSSPEKTMFCLQDSVLANVVTKTLNEFSYVVEQGKVATREDSTLVIATQHYQEIEAFVNSQKQYDHRRSKLTAAERKKKHDENPAQREKDISAIKTILSELKSEGEKDDNTISFTYSTNSQAKYAIKAVQSWSYLLGKDLIAEKELLRISLPYEDFVILHRHFIVNAAQPGTASLVAADPSNPAAQTPQMSNTTSVFTTSGCTP